MHEDFKKRIPVYLLTFVNVISFSLLIPVYPFLIRQLGDTEVWLGILMSLYSVFQLVGAPVMGSLSDRYGRKPILLLTQFGTFLSWFILGAAYFVPTEKLWGIASGTILVIAISRIVDGITGGNISVTNAYLSDITPKEERSKQFGYVGAIFGVGLIIGPGIGAISMGTSLGFLATAIIGAIISGIALISMYFFLVESLPGSKRAQEFDCHPIKEINIFSKIRKWSKDKIISGTLIFRLIIGTVLSGYVTIISLYVIDEFGLNEIQLGYFLFFVGSFLIFNQAVMVKHFVSRFGDFKTTLIGSGLMTLGLGLMVFAPSLFLYIVFYYINNLGVSLTLPTIQSRLSNHVSEQQQGEILGVSDSVGAFATIYAPILTAYLYTISGGWVFFELAMLPLFGLLMYFFFYRE